MHAAPGESATAAVPGKSPFALPAPGPPGPAYLTTRRGIAVINADGSTGLIRKSDVTRLQVGADGRAYFATWEPAIPAGRIYRLDGAKVALIATIKSYLVESFAITSDGTIFAAAHHDELHTIRDGKATMEVLQETGGIRSMFTTPTSLVVRGTNGFSSRSFREPGAMWKPFAASGFVGPQVCATSLDAWATGTGLQRLNAARDGFSKQEITQEPTSHCRIADSGLVAAQIYSPSTRLKEEVLLIDPNGATKRVRLPAGGDAEAMALDGAGRISTFFDGKLFVTPENGSPIVKFDHGSLPDLRGIVGADHALIVLGAGPSLPTPASPRMMTVKGKLVRGRPLAATKIELCNFAMTSFRGASPCTHAGHTAYATTTDESGNFSLDVPVEDYALTYFEGRWSIPLDTFIAPRESTRGAKPVVDLGTIRLR